MNTAVTLPGGFLIPAGLDPVLADLIAAVNHPDHGAWLGQVMRIGGCAHPLHFAGSTRARHRLTGDVVYEYSSREAPGGVVLARCRNRRASVCPSCARLYAGDVYHLVRAGLDGGKGIPQSVAEHPRVFATLTAPSFGAVHTSRAQKNGTPAPCHPRRTPDCDHTRPSACFARHGDDDPLVGTPLCARCYDYPGSVVWQASVGILWHRFTTYLPRYLAALSGRTRADIAATVRLSYVKVVEFQRRGLVHVHGVIRADAIPDDEPDGGPGSSPTLLPPPAWVTADLMERAVTAAAAAVKVTVHGGNAGSWMLGWGVQLDVHDISARPGQQSKVAAYVAKYATKSTEVTGWDASGRADTPRAVHTAAMAAAAFALAEVPELAGLKLGRWVRELCYRGHVSSKSRRYSTTLGALRLARATQQAAAGIGTRPQNDGSGVVVESSWDLVGFGYSGPGQVMLAADVARDVELNRAASREAGAARPGWEGGDSARRPDSVSERGAREAPQSWVTGAAQPVRAGVQSAKPALHEPDSAREAGSW